MPARTKKTLVGFYGTREEIESSLAVYRRTQPGRLAIISKVHGRGLPLALELEPALAADHEGLLLTATEIERVSL